MKAAMCVSCVRKVLTACALFTTMGDEAEYTPEQQAEHLRHKVRTAHHTITPCNTLHQLLTNEFDYNTHIAYISALRALGKWDQLRHARTKFTTLFPATEGE